MAKQKRKVTDVTGVKNKKLKKASAEKILRAPEATQGTQAAHPKGAAACRDPELSPELSLEEKRVLERKLKKERKKEERKRLREAGVTTALGLPAEGAGAQRALDYLRGWAQKHETWRFQKTRQTWLLTHMYDSDKVPEEQFPTLLAYLEGLKGQARELTVQKAEALMQKLDEAGASGPDPLLLGKTQRVRQVLQLLS
ncbi:protein cholesin isoform X5 [Rhinolophus sinicus]|uniref:protein cholesin isoform X5 n=1 Tax=Rhinolophus sinicus TaxID=89399 RepID=UPI003D7A5EAD